MNTCAAMSLHSFCAQVVEAVNRNLHPRRLVALRFAFCGRVSHRMVKMLRCSCLVGTAQLAKLVPGFAGCSCSSAVEQHGMMGHRRGPGCRTGSVHSGSAVLARSCVGLGGLGPSANEWARRAVVGRVLLESESRLATWSCHVLHL